MDIKNCLPVIVVLALFYFAMPAQAQKTLEFNQVLNFKVGGSYPDVAAFTVPANKVWKIESAGTAYSGTSYLYLQDSSGERIWYMGGNSGDIVHYPYWLPSGFSGFFERSFNSSSGGGSISIIEFNVVQ